jgi:hypothetical protein
VTVEATGGDKGKKRPSAAAVEEEAEDDEEAERQKSIGEVRACVGVGLHGTGVNASGRGRVRVTDESAPSSSACMQMMESTFTGMRYIKKDDRTVHERIMEQYINEKLEAKGLGEKKGGSGGGKGMEAEEAEEGQGGSGGLITTDWGSSLLSCSVVCLVSRVF